MKKKLLQKLPFQRKQQKKQDYYELLEVHPTVNQDDILKSYIRLLLKYKSNQPNESREQFVKIGRAYEVLSDPNRRSAYDRYLIAGGNGDRSVFESPDRSDIKSDYQNYHQTFAAHTDNGNDSGYGNLNGNRNGNRNRNGISEKGLHMAKRVAGVTGGVVGAVVGSTVGQRVAGKAGGFTRTVLTTSGSIIGSAVASDASSKMVQNVHDQIQNKSKGGVRWSQYQGPTMYSRELHMA